MCGKMGSFCVFCFGRMQEYMNWDVSGQDCGTHFRPMLAMSGWCGIRPEEWRRDAEGIPSAFPRAHENPSLKRTEYGKGPHHHPERHELE
jgi:hypothetical protein